MLTLSPTIFFLLIMSCMGQCNNPKQQPYRPKRRHKFLELLKSKLRSMLIHFAIQQPSRPHSRPTNRRLFSTPKKKQTKLLPSFRKGAMLSSLHKHLAANQSVHKSVNTAEYSRNHRRMNFDSDSFDICIDNCASASITNCLSDSIHSPKPSGQKIRGISGTARAAKVGTVLWAIQDDKVGTHAIKIPNTYYVPSIPCRLLSPQHWAFESKDDLPAKDGTWCATFKDKVILQWDQRKYQRTIHLDPSSNVAILRLAPGINRYSNKLQGSTGIQTSFKHTRPWCQRSMTCAQGCINYN